MFVPPVFRAHFVLFCQFTEQEKKLMEASTEFHHKVNELYHVKASIQSAFCTLFPLTEGAKVDHVRFVSPLS